jgi:hypothetical protein
VYDHGLIDRGPVNGFTQLGEQFGPELVVLRRHITTSVITIVLK